MNTSAAHRRQGCPRAFTLIELLVTVAILSILIGVLLPTLGSGVRQARGFKCQASLRRVVFDFTVFANPELHGDRGDDRTRYARGQFSLETFIESQYGVDEFWAYGDSQEVIRPDGGDDPMRCPEVRGDVSLRQSTPCRDGAINPPQSVSFGFNLRLYKGEFVNAAGQPQVREVTLDSEITGGSHGRVPLALDVDGHRAQQLGALVHFTAPSLDSLGPYADDRMWFPSTRHGGRMNVAFIDGSVESTADPLTDTSWRWEYQPRQ